MTTDPRPRPEPDRDGLVSLIAEHPPTETECGPLYCKPCSEAIGDWVKWTPEHLADVIRDHLRAVLGDEGLREAVFEAIRQNGPLTTDYTLGAVHDQTDAALAVVADRLGLGEA